MHRTVCLLIALTSLATLAVPAAAGAADPDAPPGAADVWLPEEAWVMERRLPYDEARLFALLRVDRPTVWRWLRDNSRSLAELAAKRGAEPRVLARDLLAPRRGAVDAKTYRALLARTQRTLTQPHLAQHVLFHDFHQWSFLRATPSIFGVPDATMWRTLRLANMTPLEIGRRYGRTRTQMRTRLTAELRRVAQRGVQAGSMSQAQGATVVANQRRRMGVWMRKRLHDRDAPPAAQVAGAEPRDELLCPL